VISPLPRRLSVVVKAFHGGAPLSLQMSRVSKKAGR
jgi:hypothetical protein